VGRGRGAAEASTLRDRTLPSRPVDAELWTSGRGDGAVHGWWTVAAARRSSAT